MFSIKNKLIFAMSTVLALVLGFAVFSITVASTENTRLRKLFAMDVERDQIQTIALGAANLWQFLTDASLTQNQASVDSAKANLDKAMAAIDKVRTSEKDPARLSTVDALSKDLQSLYDKGVAMKSAYAQSRASGSAAMDDFDLSGQGLLDSLSALAGPIDAQRASIKSAFLAIASTNRLVTLACAVVVLLIVLLG